METDYNLENTREQTERLYSDLILKSTELEKRLLKVNEYFKSTKIENKDYQKTWDSLKAIFESVKASVDKFSIDRQTLSKLFKETQDFYEKRYNPLREKISDPENGLSKTIQLSNFQKKEIDRIGVYCESQFKKIKENVKLHLENLKTLNELERKAQKIFSEITIKGNNSRTLLIEISATKKMAVKLNADIEKNAIRSNALEKEIVDLQESAITKLNSIDDLKIKSESTYKEILALYDIAADTGRSGEFDRRRKSLSLELKKWENMLFYSTIFLLFFIIILFIYQLLLYDFKIKEASTDVSFYIRFILASPIVFYITFCSVQFNHIRKLIDKYSFKTTLAASIKSHLELLKNDTRFSSENHINEILKFTLNAFGSIYKEPYNDEEMKLNLKLKTLELNIEKKNELKGKIEKLEDKFNDIAFQRIN